MTENVKHVEVLREAVEALKRTHNGFSHDYVKDEKRCDRCKLLKQADAAIAALQREAAGDGEGMTFAFMAEVCDASVQAMQANGLASRTTRLQEVRDQLRTYTAPRPTGTDKCVICSESEPYTGTCGSNDPRALCKLTTPASAEPVMRDSRDLVRAEITREDFGPAGEAGDKNYQRWLDQTNASIPREVVGCGKCTVSDFFNGRSCTLCLRTLFSPIRHEARGGGEAVAYKYRAIAHLIGSIYFAGDFKAETANERTLESLLREVGARYSSWSDVETGYELLNTPHRTPAALDAERLDYLAANPNRIIKHGGKWFAITDPITVDQFDDMRSAIDAARATTGASE